MRTADEILNDAFTTRRAPRSAEYKQGVLAALKFRIEKTEVANPFPEGTAAADAFDFGLEEGHQLWWAENGRNIDHLFWPR